jgi:hypothetical protein
MTHVVASPLAPLRAQLGDEWRELGRAVGRLLVNPEGVRSRYFQIGLAAYAPGGSARLEILTSTGQREIAPIQSHAFHAIAFGPLLTGKQRAIGVAVKSVQPHGAGAGAPLLLSPVEASYLTPGQAVMGMPALAQEGPGGLRGIEIADSTTTRFHITPGVTGSCTVAVDAAATSGTVRITAVVGRETRSAIVDARLSVVQLGPFPRPSGVVSLHATGVGDRRARENLFVSDLRIAPASP